MAPTRNPKVEKDDAVQKPAILGPTTKRSRVSHQNNQPQRSSLRRAIQESLRDSSAITAPSPSTLTLRDNANPQRRSLRQALKESLRDATATPTRNSPPSTPSPTLSFASSNSIPSMISTPTTPPSTISTPVTPTASYSSTSPSITTATTLPSATKPAFTFTLPLRIGRNSANQYEGKPSPLDNETGSYGDCNDNNDDAYERVEDAEIAEKADTQGIPTSRRGWYRVRSIIAEARNRDGRLVYLVDWEGRDPRTGIGWPSSWVNSKNVSAAAVREWRTTQDATATA